MLTGSLLPNGSYERLEDYIFNSEYSNLIYYKEIYPLYEVPKHIKEFDLPGAYIGMFSNLDNWWPLNYYETAYVSVLEEGRVFGERGIIITKDNKIIHDYSYEWPFQKPEEHTLFQNKKMVPISMELENVAILTHTFINNFYHCLIDTLPRIHLLEKSGLNIEKYIVNSSKEHELLNLFGIPSEKIIVPDENTHLKIRNMIIPSQYYVPSKWACDYIRNKFLPSTNNLEKGNKKIFITRAGTGYRNILNEEVIFSYLQKEGFEKYELEKISLADKAKLFSQAEFVIGTHGAGLTSLVFCSPGTKVLQLYPSHYVSPHFYLISDLYQLQYHYLMEKPIKTSGWEGAYNIFVDESRFFEFYQNIK